MHTAAVVSPIIVCKIPGKGTSLNSFHENRRENKRHVSFRSLSTSVISAFARDRLSTYVLIGDNHRQKSVLVFNKHSVDHCFQRFHAWRTQNGSRSRLCETGACVDERRT